MNIFNNLQQQYDQLWKYIIRPTRNTYPQQNLGPETFELEGKKIKRVDFRLVNPRGYVIFCSHFIPLEEEKYPCVIYMHGNSSNRTQGMEYLGHLMRNNISLCTFDFSGCGNSEGDYVSLGYYEQDDLNEVVEYVSHRPQITSIAIWGRSMGAVTGLLYLRKSSKICAAVFDSPFKSLKALIEDLCKKNSKIPSLIISGALKIIAGTIQEKAKFDIYKLNPLKYEVPFLTYPAFFIVGIQDDLIPPEHTVSLYEKYVGQKKYLQKVKGNHNDSRPQECVEKVIKFLLKNLKKDSKQKKLSQQKKTQIKSEKKIQQIDFFDDDARIENSSRQTQDIDFFSEDVEASMPEENLDDFTFDKANEQKPAEQKNHDSFSLTSILSNVFSGGTKKEEILKRQKDGYEESIQRISRQIFIDETLEMKKSKSKLQSFKQKINQQIKQVKNNPFQKQILANLQTWAF